jgi:hypothetical protein
VTEHTTTTPSTLRKVLLGLLLGLLAVGGACATCGVAVVVSARHRADDVRAFCERVRSGEPAADVEARARKERLDGTAPPATEARGVLIVHAPPGRTLCLVDVEHGMVTATRSGYRD